MLNKIVKAKVLLIVSAPVCQQPEGRGKRGIGLWVRWYYGWLGGMGSVFYFWFHSARERFAGEIALVVRW